MIATFCPTETTACEAALLRAQLTYIDAPLLKKLLAIRGHIKFTVAIYTSDQVPALLEGFSQANRHGSGQVVVTSARIKDWISFSEGLLFAQARDYSESLDGMGNFRRRDLVVTMTPTLGDFNEAHP
jgi:hypothetical protein